MKNFALLLVLLGIPFSANAEMKASGITVGDFVKIADLMKSTKWSDKSEIVSLSGSNRSYQIITKHDGVCDSAIIDELFTDKTLYVIPSSIEEIPCPK
jgi:hypothetical protein